jgi:EmrB/QacA subfamily drug resistance transporter
MYVAPMFTGRRLVVVFVGLQLGMILSTIDGTIVATALPRIARDLGGVSRISWVITAYFLAQVASLPLMGKLGDLYGRRRLFFVALSLFTIGSILCGLSQSINQLLASRALQGLGGGGLGTLAMAIVADIVPARQLPRWLGYQGAIFAVSSIVGPLAGGFFVDELSWRWAFYVNVPIAAVAFLVVAATLHLPYRRLPHAIDYPGATLLTGALVCFVVAATAAGGEGPQTPALLVALVFGLLALGTLFVWRERRASEPIVPMRLFANPVVRVVAAMNVTSGLLFFCGVFFLPVFLQEVAGVSPLQSGLLLVPIMFGAAFGTLVAGRRVERAGRYRGWPIAGSVLMTAGVLLLATLREGTPPALGIVYGGVLGLGVGFVMQTSLLALQNSVEHRDLGIATSTALLCRILGGAVGPAIFGAVLNAGLPDDGPRSAAAFADALPPVFLIAVPIGIFAIWIALRLQEHPLREHAHFGPDTIATPWSGSEPPTTG